MFARGVLYSLAVYLVRAQQDTPDECKFNHTIVHNEDKIMNITETCTEVPCLIKCCAENQILFDDETQVQVYCKNVSYLETTYNVTNLEDYSAVKIYNQDKNLTEKTIENFIVLHYDNFIYCNDFIRQVFADSLVPYILEDGRYRLEMAELAESFKMGTFCFENYLSINSTSPHIVIYNVDNAITADPETEERTVITTYGMMISCFFIFLVLVVYGLLKELRNLAGIMLMANVATLMVFFLLRIIHIHLNSRKLLNTTQCAVMTLLIYYALLSSFCWMNIMSFDIWRILRAIRKQQPTSRRGILAKFGWYALYAWGLPLVPAVFAGVVDNMDMTHLPGFVKPDIFQYGQCFFRETSHKWYVVLPLSILLCSNLILFLMTVFNIWRVRRAVSQSQRETRKSSKKTETRFSLVLKLSLVMGITWILELVEDENNPHWVWYISDNYNSCSGLLIFIIFVCKRDVILRLCTRLSIDNKWVRSLRERSGPSTQHTSTQHSSRS